MIYNIEIFKPRFHARKDCRKMNCLSSPPRVIGSRGTQTKFVCRIVKSLCAKFGAFFRSVTIFSLNHLTISEASAYILSKYFYNANGNTANRNTQKLTKRFGQYPAISISSVNKGFIT